MYKKDFIAAVAKDTKLAKKDVAKVVDSIADTIVKAMKKDDIIQWKGLGTFKIVVRSARICRDLRTGKQVKVPARKVVAFKKGTLLNDIKR